MKKSSALMKSRPSTGLSKYDPDRGLKNVAVADAAIKHYARAKDATKLLAAIRAKLEAQAEFVYWWDTQVEKSKGGRPEKTRSRSATGFEAGKEGIPDRYVIDRWRKKLNDPDKFEAAYRAACTRYSTLLEFEKTAHVGHNSGENEWYTPTAYIEAARQVLGQIDLDPASSLRANAVVKAERFFDSQTNGLAQDWKGRVWMNPPYAQPLIGQFCDKLVDSVAIGNVSAAVVLVNNASETSWYHALMSLASALCGPRGRVSFWSPRETVAAPLQGQSVIYFGPRSTEFRQAFSVFGWTAVLR